MSEPKLTILLVDDNPDDLAMVRANILSYSSKSRYSIVDYNDPSRALDWLINADDGLPDCLILDLHMPQMDGLRFLKTLRDAHAGIVPLPVILLTGSTFDDQDDIVLAKQTLQLGAQDYITKNGLRPEWLMRTVHNAIERYQLVQEIRNIDEQHRLATDAINLGTWTFKRDSANFICSSRCQDILRLDGNRDWVFEDFFTHIHGDDILRVRSTLDEALQAPQNNDFHMEYRILLDDGLIRWVNVAGRAYELPDGDVHVRGTILDVTERKQAEYELANSEQQFQLLVNSIPQLAWITDPAGAAVWYNQRWYTYTGTDFETTKDDGWAALIHPDHAKRVVDHFHEALVDGRAWEDVFPIRDADGAYRWFLSQAFPITDVNGRITRWFGTNTDVNEQREAENIIRQKEAHFRQMANLTTAMLWKTDVTGQSTFFSSSWYEFTGMNEEDSLNDGHLSAIHPDDHDAVVRVYDAASAERIPYKADYRLRRFDGTYHWVIDSGRPRFDENEQFSGYIGSIFDINDRKLAEEKLIESERFSRSILNNSPDCIKIMDIEGHIKEMNDSGMMQMQIDDFSTCDNVLWHEMWPSDERHKLIEALHQARKGETSWFEGFCPTAKNTPKWWEIIVSPILDSDGQPDKILAMSRDISERKVFQNKLQDALTEAQNARQRAEEASVAKSEFLANMSHEIRTPMNAVIGLANILAISDPLTQKQREFIQTLQISADSLLALINDLLDISKIEARSVDIEHVAFSLPQLMQDVVSVMSLRAREKNLSFTVDDTAVQNDTYLGDPARIKQIVMNLCSNALKFTHRGGVTIAVSRTALPANDEKETQHDEICITVADTGIGIAPDKVDAIFEKFVQADSSINRKYGGTGLGLAITKTLIEVMGGRIAVNSALGNGSEFKVFLPLEREEDHSHARSALYDQAMAAVDGSASSTLDTRPHILLVEDYPANVLVATMYLEEFGYRYDVANNGMEALDKAKATRYDAIIMDVQMPGMNGFEATKAIREHAEQERETRVPIIGMTAHALAGDRERCLAAGMDDYITKPFNPDDLQQKLEQAVRDGV